MIRRESFGGLIFHEPTHKVYTLDKDSFRVIEQHFIQGKTISEIRKGAGKGFSSKLVENFIKESESRLGASLFTQRGRTDDTIWSKEWNKQYFSAPISNFWTFTNLCNLRCTHCAWDSSKPLPGELETDECKRLIDDMHAMGVCELSFSGGEPLTKKKQLLEMAKYATGLGFHLGMATNATLIDSTVADELLHAGINEVQVSFEGLEAHESIRGRGVWDKTINGVRVMRSKGFDVTFAVAINKTNMHELDNIFATAKAENVKNVRFVRFVPIGRGKRNMSQFEFSIKEERSLASTLWQKRWEFFPETIITFNKHYVSIGVISNPKLGGIPDTFEWNWDCPSGRSRICIMPQGKIAPCPLIGSLGLDGGSIKEIPLQKLWDSSEFFQFIRSKKSEHNKACRSCNLWSKCSGGCKAASYAFFEDLMAPDPLCLRLFCD